MLGKIMKENRRQQLCIGTEGKEQVNSVEKVVHRWEITTETREWRFNTDTEEKECVYNDSIHQTHGEKTELIDKGILFKNKLSLRMDASILCDINLKVNYFLFCFLSLHHGYWKLFLDKM